MEPPQRRDDLDQRIAGALGELPRRSAPPRLAERVRRQVRIENMIAEQRRQLMRALSAGVLFIAGILGMLGWLVTGAPAQWIAQHVPGLFGRLDYYAAPLQTYWPVLLAFTLFLVIIPSAWSFAAASRRRDWA